MIDYAQRHYSRTFHSRYYLLNMNVIILPYCLKGFKNYTASLHALLSDTNFSQLIDF